MIKPATSPLSAFLALNSGADRLQTQWLAVDGGQLAYDDTGGHGPLVLALPGMGDLRLQYREIRPHLVNAGYRVVSMDVRGQGESSIRWPDYSARATGRDALRLMRHLGVHTAVILGNSFAAGSALWAAHEAPEHVRGAVLLGPIVRDIPQKPWIRAALRLGFAGPWRQAFWMSYWDSLFPFRKPADHKLARTALLATLREPGRMKALQDMVQLSKADTAALLPRSRVPSLIVMGGRDPDFPDAAAEARWLGDALKSKPLILPQAGHYPHLEQPELVAPALLEFLARQLPT